MADKEDVDPYMLTWDNWNETCVKGHPIVTKLTGERFCHTCKIEGMRAWRLRQKAAK